MSHSPYDGNAKEKQESDQIASDRRKLAQLLGRFLAQRWREDQLGKAKKQHRASQAECVLRRKESPNPE